MLPGTEMSIQSDLNPPSRTMRSRRHWVPQRAFPDETTAEATLFGWDRSAPSPIHRIDFHT